MVKLPVLDFHYHGHVTQDEQQEIRDTLTECYPRLSRWLPERVEVQLFETPAQLSAFLESEKTDLDIKTSSGVFYEECQQNDRHPRCHA